MAVVACGSPPSTRSAPSAPQRTECTVALRFEDETPGDDEPSLVALPRTRVTLVRICDPGGTETRFVGNEPGVCQFSDPAGALVRARCWWGSEGSELEVHRVLRQVVVRRAAWTDADGTGAFTDAVELDLPPGAELNVLAPDTLPHHP